MGRGSSKAAGGGNSATSPANTPSGINYDQFMQMTEQQRFDTIGNILDNQNIQVPAYLDPSDASKVIYALGMNNKMNVVDEATLDSMPGKEVFRCVYDSSSGLITSKDILDQIKNGDYTQLSNAGGSVHGRALYFATDYYDAAVYGHGRTNAQVMRAKINPNAKIVSESNLLNQMSQKGLASTRYGSSTFGNRTVSGTDSMALYALSQGLDGWYSGSYTMVVNRGNMTASKTNKTIRSGRSNATSWSTANNAK